MEIERKRSFIIRVIYFLILAAIAVVLIKYGLPMLAPFVIAAVIVGILHRPICFFSRKLKIPYKPMALLTVLLFYCTIGLLIFWAIVKAVSGVRSIVEMLPQLYSDWILPAAQEVFIGIERIVLEMDGTLFTMVQGFEQQIMDWLGGLVPKLSTWAVGAASNVAVSVPGLFIKLVLLVISTFFIAADYDVLTGFCLRQLNKDSRALVVQIKDYVVGTLLVCIGSYLIIMSITFVELTIGFSIIGLQYAPLIAALIALFDILPVLGTGGIMIPWSVINFLQGDLKMGLSLLIIYIAVTIIRNIVEPKIVGKQLGLHPIVTLASMFAGAQLLGVVGLFGFPIGLSLLRYLNDNGSIHIFRSEKEEAAEKTEVQG